MLINQSNRIGNNVDNDTFYNYTCGFECNAQMGNPIRNQRHHLLSQTLHIAI